MISIVSDPALEYPVDNYAFAPEERYPELPNVDPAPSPNAVYRAVRAGLIQAGFDSASLNTAKWNPLGAFVKPGSRVLVLCNFVYHRRPNESAEAFRGKCTHASVLRPLIDYALRAAGPGGRVVFGNAPLQSCDWRQVLADTGADKLADFYAARGLPVSARDLRLVIRERSVLGNTTHVENRDEARDAVEIDLRDVSLLDELQRSTGQEARFRVADYDPRRTTAFHANGSHRYVINRAALEADCIISVPKLKTHEKVGITCGLKGFVGAVGHKDSLAHHRFGTPNEGGDEYPDASSLRTSLSRMHDTIQMRNGNGAATALMQTADRLVRRVLHRTGAIQGGAWHGNDTAWRMALDLAHILYYADSSGQLRDTQQRQHVSVIDGVIGGEGEGPLAPDPVHTGVLVVSDNVAAGDWAAARLMGYEPEQIPLLREAFRPGRYALPGDPESEMVRFDGEETRIRNLTALRGRPFAPPPGWRDYLTLQS